MLKEEIKSFLKENVTLLEQTDLVRSTADQDKEAEDMKMEMFCYLDGFSFDLHRLLPEVHADGGLRLVGKAAAGEAERQTGLPHVGVPDDDDLKDPRLDAQLQGGCDAWPGVGAAAASSTPDASVEIHGGGQDGHIVLRSISAFPTGTTTLLLRGIVGHCGRGGDALIGVRVKSKRRRGSKRKKRRKRERGEEEGGGRGEEEI